MGEGVRVSLCALRPRTGVPDEDAPHPSLPPAAESCCRVQEMEAFLTFFDVETRATIALSEFLSALKRLKARSLFLHLHLCAANCFKGLLGPGEGRPAFCSRPASQEKMKWGGNPLSSPLVTLTQQSATWLTSCVPPRPSFSRAQERSSRPEPSVHYTSFVKYKEDSTRHQLACPAWQRSLTKPITASQEYGWSTVQPSKPKEQWCAPRRCSRAYRLRMRRWRAGPASPREPLRAFVGGECCPRPNNASFHSALLIPSPPRNATQVWESVDRGDARGGPVKQ